MKIGNLIILRHYPRAWIRHIGEYIELENLKGAEIGVWKGVNMKEAFENLPLEMIYLIDPYKAYWDEDKDYTANLEDKEKEAHQRLRKYSDRVKWIKKDSLDAVKDLPDNLDFVYIDGDHRYEQVIKECRAYWRKIREGGVMIGHDANKAYTIAAAIDFSRKVKKEIKIYGQDWFIKK